MSTAFNASNIKVGDSTFNDIHGNQINNYELVFDNLKSLPRVPEAAYYDPSRVCLPGTRQVILQEIDAWSCRPGGPSVYWLKAEAGAGKSTISHTVARQAEKFGQLGACFFLQRNYAKSRDPRLIINTLAFRLALFNDDIAAAIKTALDNDPDLGSIDSIQVKFDRLILGPIAAVKPFVQKPILLVIDDLDSLDTKNEDARSRRRDFLQYIGLRQFPPVFKILVTSRPERDIIHAFENIGPRTFHNSSSDIALLARELLDGVMKMYRLEYPWPESTVFDALVRRSGQLFIWIKAACQFIAQRDPLKRLELVLKGDPTHGAGEQLDKLYRDALLNHAEKDGDDDDEFYDMFRRILGCITNLRNPLTPESIDSILGLPPNIQSRHTIELFKSFLHITEEGVVRPIHPSFIEFLSDEERCGTPLLFIGSEHKQVLAKRCLTLMLTFLKRNVCSLADPLLRNNTATKDKIPEYLLYACQFWADHLQSVQVDDDTYNLVKEFFSTKVVFWIEVLSLAGVTSDAIPALLGVQAWAEKDPSSNSELLVLISDTIHFVDEFRPILLKSAGYIYESAFPLTPYRTALFQSSSGLVGKLPSVRGAKYQHWDPHRTIEVRSAAVRSAAWSPDGTKIVIGTWNHDIFICNTADGSFVGEVLQGHSGVVRSVAFSPNGEMIASGSEDCTVCLWGVDGNKLLRKIPVNSWTVYSVAFSPDGTKIVVASWGLWIWDVGDGTLVPIFQSAQEICSVAFSSDGHKLVSGSYYGEVRIWSIAHGEPIGKPFVGHSDVVWSVAFSPDGKKVISGGGDKTICVWNTTNRTPVVRLTGHRNEVNTVSFSPDGTRIVSGSNDCTIGLFNAATGAQIVKPLKQHTSAVFVVAFSPNGMQIVSGSHDATVRIWSVVAINHPAECVIGHSDMVESVAFSPDGSKVVSGSRDRTICRWNAINGTLIGAPLTGHTDTVYCVRFSPDGRYIASASWDHTIRIWRVEDRPDRHWSMRWWTHTKTLKGHNGRVWAVEYSPDGTRVISASEDSTLRLWNVANGIQIGEPLKGSIELSPVMSFSPDGTKFISADDKHVILLWNAADSTSVGCFRGHNNTVSRAAFSPNGKQIISCSLDRTIRLWDIMDQSLVSAYPQHYFDSWRGTGLTTSNDNKIPEEMVALYDLLLSRSSGLSLINGWIRITSSSKRLWIPPRYRGVIAVNASQVCIGTATGHVVFVTSTKD